MKTILHATDYSENAIAALKFATELSIKLKSNLYVIHVFNTSTLSFDLNETYLLPFKETLKQKNEVKTAEPIFFFWTINSSNNNLRKSVF